MRDNDGFAVPPGGTGNPVMTPIGFATASGKATPVSEKALKAARKRFADLDTEEVTNAELAYLTENSLLCSDVVYLNTENRAF